MSNAIGPQGFQRGPLGPHRAPGALERFLGRAVEVVLGSAVVIFFGAVALGLLLAGLYWLATAVVLPAGVGAFDLVRAFGVPAIADLAGDATVGLAIGALVGLVRYRSRVRSGRVEEIVDAVASSEILSTPRLGALTVAAHAMAGVAAGAIVGWLGIPLPQLLSGDAHAALARATPVVEWILGAGGPGGGGDGAGLPMLAVALAALLLFLLAGGAATLGLGLLAQAMASGAAGTIGKSFGVALSLSLTRLSRGARALPRRPPRGPLALETAVAEFIAAQPGGRAAPSVRTEVEGYIRWARGRGLDPLDPSDTYERRRYYGEVVASGGAPPHAVWKFAEWLPRALAEHARPLAPEASDDAAWLAKLAREAFGPGWMRRTIATGAIAGAAAGGLEALLGAGMLRLLGR